MENIFYIDGLKITNSTESESRLDIDGYCCHFGKANLNNEMVDKKSFSAFFDLYNSGRLKPALNWNHEPTVIGGIDELKSDETGLYMKAHINKDVAICRDMIIPNILAGDLDSFSTEGYVLNGYNGIVENEDGSYYVKDFMLTSVAVVSTPADYDAKFTVKNYIEQMKSHEEVEEQEEVSPSNVWVHLM